MAIIFEANIIFIQQLFQPERFSPGGVLNLIGNSHNIWHIVVLVTLMNWRHALLEMLKYRIEVPCT